MFQFDPMVPLRIVVSASPFSWRNGEESGGQKNRFNSNPVNMICFYLSYCSYGICKPVRMSSVTFNLLFVPFERLITGSRESDSNQHTKGKTVKLQKSVVFNAARVTVLTLRKESTFRQKPKSQCSRAKVSCQAS